MMKATTSPMGVVTDPPLVAIATSAGVIAALGAYQSGAAPLVVQVLCVVAAAPITIAVFVTLLLSGARRKTVDWLASLPFPLDNLNSVLNGMGESLEVTLTSKEPATEEFYEGLSKELNKELDRVHVDTFVTKWEAETRLLEVRIGVVDSKRNPARSNHQRFMRVKALVDTVLVPFHEQHVIESVRVK